MSELDRALRTIDASGGTDSAFVGLGQHGDDDHTWLTGRHHVHKFRVAIASIGLIALSLTAIPLWDQLGESQTVRWAAQLFIAQDSRVPDNEMLLPTASDTGSNSTEAAPSSAPQLAPPFHDQASALWRGGMRREAADIWLQSLRRVPPSSAIIQIGGELETEAADRIHAQWNAELPVMMLSTANTAKELWLVFALPAASEMDRHFQALQSSLGSSVQWGNAFDTLQMLGLERSFSVTREATAVADPADVPARPIDQARPTQPAPPVTPTPPSGGIDLAVTDLTPRQGAAASALEAKSTPDTAEKSDETVTTAAGGPGNQPSATPTPAIVPNEPVAPPEWRKTDATSVSLERTFSSASSRAIEQDFRSIEGMLSALQYTEALARTRQLEGTVGRNWRIQYLTGAALSGLGQWQEAKSALEFAWRGNPGHLRVSLYLAVAQQEMGLHEEALITLRSALETHPEAPELWLNQGHSLQALGRNSDAQLSYWRFMDFSAQRPDLLTQRAWVQNRFTRVKP